MAGPLPDTYVDGCTIGPKRFGRVDHSDICNRHDQDWWVCRTIPSKIASDARWASGVFVRHVPNGVWIFPATIYVVIGFVFLNTAGWYWWLRK